jgi:hypothetical protein
MSSQFAGSVLLLQEAVGVSCYQSQSYNHLKQESRLTRGMFPLECSIQSLGRGVQIVTFDMFRHTFKA